MCCNTILTAVLKYVLIGLEYLDIIFYTNIGCRRQIAPTKALSPIDLLGYGYGFSCEVLIKDYCCDGHEAYSIRRLT